VRNWEKNLKIVFLDSFNTNDWSTRIGQISWRIGRNLTNSL